MGLGIIALIISLIIFFLILKKNRYFSLLGVSFIFIFLSTIYIFAELAYTYDIKIFFVLIALILIPFFITLIFGIYILIGFLLYTSYKMFKNEGFSFRNSLTFIIAIALIIYSIISIVSGNINNHIFKFIWSYLTILFTLGVVFVVVFLLNTFLVNIIKPRKKPNYLIILGSGLINGKVPPLLAARINKGLNYLKTNNLNDVKVIFSGGKGSDEPISEAQAMQEYAIENGLNPENTLLENQSKNTLENLKYSKALIEQETMNYFALFFTNNFHLFRAGLYAHKVGLKGLGIGSKTALYFLPNALAREYIALVVIQKKYYTVILIIVTLVFLFSYIIAIIN